MSRDDDPRDELLRRLDAVISGAELDDLRHLVGELSLLGGLASQQASQSQRPELRRPPRLVGVEASLDRQQQLGRWISSMATGPSMSAMNPVGSAWAAAAVASSSTLISRAGCSSEAIWATRVLLPT